MSARSDSEGAAPPPPFFDEHRVDGATADAVAGQVTRAAAVHGEGVLAYCRLFFCAAILVRFLSMAEPLPASAYVLNVTALLTGMAFSSWVLWMRRTRRDFTIALVVGGVADGAVAFCSLLQTALWTPIDRGFSGVFSSPDLSILPLLVFTAAFRLSPWLAALSGVVNGASVIALLEVDRHRFGDHLGYGSAQVTLFALVFVTAVMASVLMAVRIRSLVAAAANTSLRMESTRVAMTELLRDQHDTRSLLSSASVHAELVRRALASPAADTRRALAWAETIREDLTRVNTWVQALGERTFASFSMLREPEIADAGAILPATLALLRRRFPELRIEDALAELPRVRLVGGGPSLQRILYNVILNAVEGDGTRGALTVRLAATVERGHWLLHVEDDGPGFRADAQQGPDGCVSSKPAGNGLGLYGIAQLLRASGGDVWFHNRAPAGATVHIRLRLAADDSASTRRTGTVAPALHQRQTRS